MTDSPIRKAFEEAVASGRAFIDPKDGVIRANDRSNAPLVYDEATGQLEKKTRITTYIKVLEVDHGGLDAYKQAQVLLGIVNELAANPKALDRAMQYLAGRSYDEIKEDGRAKGVMFGQVKDFENAGGSHRKAWWGDMIHALTQAYEESARTFTAEQAVEAAWDKVEEMYIEKMATTRVTFDPKVLHDRLVVQVQLYIDAMADVEVVECEQRVYSPELGTFGTPDRLCRFDGVLFHADVKTGNPGTIEEQMAVAAISEPYDYTHGVQPRPAELRPSREIALLIDMPGPGLDWMGAPGRPEYILTWLDIRSAGKKVAAVIPLVLEARSAATARTAFDGKLPEFASAPAKKKTRSRTLKKAAPAPEAPAEPTAAEPEVDPVLAEIKAARNRDEAEAVWRRLTGGKKGHPAWLPQYQQAATDRLAEIKHIKDTAGTSAAA